MIYKYGSFATDQFDEALIHLRKKIFVLLLMVDPKTKQQYEDMDVVKAFTNLQLELSGMNSVLDEPPELVHVVNLLEAALCNYTSAQFDFQEYRKAVLDAGSEIMKIKEG